jgi:hypothetical protein
MDNVTFSYEEHWSLVLQQETTTITELQRKAPLFYSTYPSPLSVINVSSRECVMSNFITGILRWMFLG